MEKDRKVRVANALALTMAIIWVACSIVVLFLPDLSMTVANWWMHGLDMRAMGEWNLTPTSFFMGGLTVYRRYLAIWLDFGLVLGGRLTFFDNRGGNGTF